MPSDSDPRIEWRCPHCARVVESSRAYCARCDEDSPPLPVEVAIGRLIDGLVDRIEVLERVQPAGPTRPYYARSLNLWLDADGEVEPQPPRPTDPQNYTEFLSDDEYLDVVGDGLLDQITKRFGPKPN